MNPEIIDWAFDLDCFAEPETLSYYARCEDAIPESIPLTIQDGPEEICVGTITNVKNKFGFITCRIDMKTISKDLQKLHTLATKYGFKLILEVKSHENSWFITSIKAVNNQLENYLWIESQTIKSQKPLDYAFQRVEEFHKELQKEHGLSTPNLVGEKDGSTIPDLSVTFK